MIGPSHAGGAQTAATRSEDIVGYWSRLRGNRRFPAKADLDLSRIVAEWPSSLMVRCRKGSRVLEPERRFGPTPGGNDEPDLSQMLLQWVLGLAREAVSEERPMQDLEVFDTRAGNAQFRAVALPFGEDEQRGIDHILCHVAPAP